MVLHNILTIAARARAQENLGWPPLRAHRINDEVPFPREIRFLKHLRSWHQTETEIFTALLSPPKRTP